MFTILIVDDEVPIANLIRTALSHAGYDCTVVNDGKAAADLIEARDFDLIMLDIMLPYISGYDLMEYIAPLNIPVIFLTAKSDVLDKVKGLRMGADDYIVKPFDPTELVARVEAVLRRYNKGNVPIIAWDVSLAVTNRQVTRSGKSVSLTPREMDLLIILMQNRGKTLYREYLYESVWGEENDMDTRTLDTHIQRLRRKLDWSDKIKTMYKVGYKLEAE
ncbi:MAG: response regulator transcription factor [Oscillospiraceae bacterium]